MKWPWQRGHRHVWKPVGVDQMKVSQRDWQTMQEYISDRTVVLLRCECGEMKIKNLVGTWTLEQLQ